MPATGWASRPFNGLIQTLAWPCASRAVNAMWRPSGESRGEPTTGRPSGAAIWKRTTCGGSGARRAQRTAKATAVIAASVATPHANRSRTFRRADTSAGSPTCEPPSAIHLSCNPTSWAAPKRSSGSFARQVSTTRSKAGGPSGTIFETGSGVECMTEPMRLAWVRPSKALRPVAIS